MNAHARALVFCAALFASPLFVVLGEQSAGLWGKIALPVLVVAAATAYALFGQPPEA